jgi:hypothetical protein
METIISKGNKARVCLLLILFCAVGIIFAQSNAHAATVKIGDGGSARLDYLSSLGAFHWSVTPVDRTPHTFYGTITITEGTKRIGSYSFSKSGTGSIGADSYMPTSISGKLLAGHTYYAELEGYALGAGHRETVIPGLGLNFYWANRGFFSLPLDGILSEDGDLQLVA